MMMWVMGQAGDEGGMRQAGRQGVMGQAGGQGGMRQAGGSSESEPKTRKATHTHPRTHT